MNPTDLVGGLPVFATNPGLVPDHVGTGIWKEFVPAALVAGTLQAKPDPKVLTGGLQVIQEALELQKSVSAQKIVVEL